MTWEFTKYQGTGNDFAIFHDPDGSFPTENNPLIHRICDRKMGIGADGVMVLRPDPDCDFRMLYFNADGKEGTMCGNGGRCIVHFAFSLGLAKAEGSFIAIDGPHDFTVNTDTVSLKMIDVTLIEQLNDHQFVLDTGSPHFIDLVDDPEEIDVVKAGREIRFNDRFKAEGINVNFVQRKNDGLSMRTYERGVEDETLSCGTGVTAAALVHGYLSQLETGNTPVQVKGGNLSVSFQKNGTSFSNIWLTGPATPVFKGQIEL